MKATQIVPYMLAALVGGFIAFGVYLMVFSPMLATASSTRADTATLSTKNDALQARTELIRLQEANLPALVSDVKKFTVQFPSRMEQKRLIDDISAVGSKLGVDVETVVTIEKPQLVSAQAAQATKAPAPAADGTVPVTETPQPAATPAPQPGVQGAAAAITPGQGLYSMSVTISASGDDLGQMEEFIAALEQMQRPLKIDSFKLNLSEKEATAEATGSVYIAAPLIEPVRGKAEAPVAEASK